MKSLVIIEHDGKNIKQTSLSTITAAGKICKEVEVIALGSNISEVVDKLKKTDIISKVNYSDDDFLKFQIAENLSEVITSFLKEKDFSHILLPSTTFGKNLGPKIATTLDVQQISDIIEIFDHETFARPIYAGNAISKVKSKDSLKVITVRPTCFEPCAQNSNVSEEKFEISSNQTKNVEFVDYNQSESDRPELTSAKIVISGGRGMQNGENFKLLEGIADKLGAAMGASRAAVDAGFVPNDWQVGQTGKIVAPDLYIAVGISGAIQHIAGIKDSKFIACINKDEEAPIFNFSDYGVVGDLFEVLPKLENELK